MKFNYSTREQTALRLRERFAVASELEALKIALWFSKATDADLSKWFKITDTSLLRTKLNNYSTVLGLIKSAVGQ